MTSNPAITEPGPTVSIVITNYNRAALVGRAVQSAIHQTYRNLAIIIIDDGSTDNSVEVLRRYEAADPRVRVIALPHNLGVNAAKNAGLDAAGGEYTTMLDSDDEFLPEAITTFLALFEDCGSSYGMVFCNCIDPATGEWTGSGLEEDTDVSYQDVLCLRISGEFSGMWRTTLAADLRFKAGQGPHESLVWNQIYRRAKVRYKHVVVRKYYRGTPGSVITFKFDQASIEQRLPRFCLILTSLLKMSATSARRNWPRHIAS